MVPATMIVRLQPLALGQESVLGRACLPRLHGLADGADGLGQLGFESRARKSVNSCAGGLVNWVSAHMSGVRYV